MIVRYLRLFHIDPISLSRISRQQRFRNNTLRNLRLFVTKFPWSSRRFAW